MAGDQMTAAPATLADGFSGFVTSSETRASLTPMQYRLIVLLADGRTREAAAYAVGISRPTANIHMKLAFENLGVDSLVAAYAKLGWLKVPE